MPPEPSAGEEARGREPRAQDRTRGERHRLERRRAAAERLTGTSHSHGSMVHQRRRGGKGGRRRRRGKGGREARCKTGGEVTGAGPASTRRTAAIDRGRGVEAPDARRERRAVSDSAARRLEIWNVKLGLGLGAARSGACLLYQEGEPASRGGGLLGQLMGHGGTGPPPGRLFGPGRARAVPQARVAAQARPGRSGRAGPGPVATVPCRSRVGPKRRAVGQAASPRAAWPSIPGAKSERL